MRRAESRRKKRPALNAFVALISSELIESGEKISINMLAYRHLPPTPHDAAIAHVSVQALSRFAQARAPLKLLVPDSELMVPIELPAGVLALLREILEAMEAGRGVSIIPENAELSTLQAAEVLNVSRPFLIKLLEDGSIPHRNVGKHRCVRMEDVMPYKAATDNEREAVLDQMATDAQEQNMGCGSKSASKATNAAKRAVCQT